MLLATWTRKLLAKLLDKERRRYVISIWGTGGLGKTTLAGKLYKDSEIKTKFRCRAWVSVSQVYMIEDLLLRIIKSFNFYEKKRERMSEENLERYEKLEKLEIMSEEDLERYLHKCLQGRSYFVVIDDVWHKEAWASLKRAFSDNRNGSRVIITTRNKDVAERSDERTHVHELRFLSPDESWQLFCEKAFWNLKIDEGLEKLGREMVEKCRGLPLAIVVLGGLLSTKKPQEWYSVRDNIWQNCKNFIEITYLFTLSFQDLPNHLKLCFLYLSHFPEDFEIKTKTLIRLWVAEGYIPHDEETMEDLAHSYLNELINRSLVRKETMRLRTVRTCRVHDLLRDFAIQEAKELNSAGSSERSCRKAAIYSKTNTDSWHEQFNESLRSLLFFDKEYPTVGLMIPNLCAKFTLLRVLVFEGYNGESTWSLTADIDRLIHLKYLGVRGTCIDYIPESILNLSNLETLDLRGSYPYVPTEICKLQNLRHLNGYLVEKYLRIDNMTNLQTLKHIGGDTWTKTSPEKLVNLRELSVYFPLGSQEEISFDSFAKLKNLRILLVALLRNHFLPSLQPLCHCRYLQKLSLTGKMEKLPGEMPELFPNLENLSMTDSELEDDPMPILEKMLNLTVLCMQADCYLGEKLVCTAKGFPRLEILILEGRRLKVLQVGRGAMPLLRGFEIGAEVEVRMPERLRSIPPPECWEF